MAVGFCVLCERGLYSRWLEEGTITHMEEPMLNELGTQETNLRMCFCRLLCAC